MAEFLEKSYEQEVFERGLAQGEARGEARGEAQGKAKALGTSLETLLRQCFHEVPDGVRQRIASVELASLERAIF
jgi:predicted transposase YdaD